MYYKKQVMDVYLRLSKYFLLIIICLIIFGSCTQIDLHEKNVTVPNNKWQSDFVAKSTFTITDSVCKYKVYVVLRHTDAYEYNNIWLNVGLQQMGEATNYLKLNLNLSNDKNGWSGVGMNDIWEVREIIANQTLKKGTYSTSIQQLMRQNPLLHIISVGIRVEKVV